MNNKEFYRESFDEVHVPDAVLRKVRNMKVEQSGMKRKSKLKYAAAMAAVLLVCFIASNGICYAATGNTWIGKVTMYINGEKMEKDITFHKDGDSIYGEIKLDKNPDEVEVIVPDEASSGQVTYDENDASAVIVFEGSDGNQCGELVSENGKNYLVIGEELLKIDITEDFADGKCSGTFELDGKEYSYEVTGDMEKYEINIK